MVPGDCTDAPAVPLQDLSSPSQYDTGVALTGLSCFVTPDLARDLANDIMTLVSLCVPASPFTFIRRCPELNSCSEETETSPRSGWCVARVDGTKQKSALILPGESQSSSVPLWGGGRAHCLTQI